MREGGSRRLVLAAFSALCVATFLTGCQVSVSTTINVSDNGSGSISVAAAADAETVRQAPELSDSLRMDDLRAAGWDVDIQNPAADGGISVVMRRNFANTEEATVLLAQLSGENGPLRNVQLSRAGGVNDATYVFRANGGLPSGLAGFADADALEVLGAAPFQEALTRSGRALPDALLLTVRLTTPGNVVESNGEIVPRASDDPSSTTSWSVPVDGADVVLSTTTRDRNVAAMIASYVARGLLVLLIVLAAGGVLYLATVVQRRSGTTPSS